MQTVADWFVRNDGNALRGVGRREVGRKGFGRKEINFPSPHY
jgi:hypothetical protein